MALGDGIPVLRSVGFPFPNNGPQDFSSVIGDHRQDIVEIPGDFGFGEALDGVVSFLEQGRLNFLDLVSGLPKNSCGHVECLCNG